MFRIWRAPTGTHLLGLGRRLMQTAAGSLEQQLAAVADLATLVQIPGAGRGLVAARAIPQGTTVHREFPMLVAPSPHALDQACYHCLQPLPPAQQQQQQPSEQDPCEQQHQREQPSGQQAHQRQQEDAREECSGGSTEAHAAGRPRFCSATCRTAANREYWQVERHCDFGPLLASCRDSGEKLPLMMARLACMMVSQWQSGGVEVVTRPGARSGRSAGQALRGNPLKDLHHLCYANLASPPPPWRDMHGLLLRGLLAHPSNSNMGSAAGWKEAVQQRLDLDWYCSALSRLHINVFSWQVCSPIAVLPGALLLCCGDKTLLAGPRPRPWKGVDTVPALPALDHAALLRAAAGLLSGAAAPAHATGSAVFLLASMLNHSCEPNLEVTWPHNNAVAAFVAARDIEPGEQLCISYVDAGMAHESRRQALHFSYGFDCRCPKCREGQ